MATQRGTRHVTDAQAMALALERLRRATDKLLTTITLGENIDGPLADLELAHASSNQDTHTHLAWAQDVLDGVRQHAHKRRDHRKESLQQVMNQAKSHNLYVHHVHTMEGTEYAIYRSQTKVAHAKTDARCISVLRRLMR